MQSDQLNFLGKPMLPTCEQIGDGYMLNDPLVSVFDKFVPPPLETVPFHSVDLNASDACPRNFIVFDHTNDQNQIVFHPALRSNFLSPGFGIIKENTGQQEASGGRNIASPLKEDSADIDALLSSEYEENKGSDSEVSTARTGATYECHSPDSCSNYESMSRKKRTFPTESSAGRGQRKKRQKLQKMMKTLKRMVPGARAQQMSNAAVLDEAVRYLKSLRVEVKKMGSGKSEA